jgi:pimeloyl-ACP methyl ester carboxylesterase
MTHRRLERTLEVPAGPGLPHPARMGATLHLPDRPDPARPILFLFPGATYARGYYDIQAEGFDGYSQAERHVAEGLVCVAIDNVGTDGSPWTAGGLTFAMMAAATDIAVRGVLADLKAGTLDASVPPLTPAAVIGIGQSMGGHVVAKTQAEHETFDAIAALGSSFTQTRLALKPGRRYPRREEGPAAIMRSVAEDVDMLASFHCAATPAALVKIDFDPEVKPPWRSRSFPEKGSDLLMPGAMAKEAAQVRVPVLLAYGEVDVTGDPLADAGAFRSTADLSLLILPRMAHMHNFAPTRDILWRRISQFAHWVAETRA